MTNIKAIYELEKMKDWPDEYCLNEEEIEAIKFALRALSGELVQKSVIIIKSKYHLDYINRIFYEDKFRKDYENGILMVPEFFDVTVVGNADGVEVRHD